MRTPTLTVYHNTAGSFYDYRWFAGNWLGRFPSGEGKLVYRDAFGLTPVLIELDFPPPLYLVMDEENAGDFSPQALKAIIIGGVILIWLSVCVLCTNNQPFPPGTDAFLHCYGGCVGCALCGCPPGLLGIGKEIADALLGGTVEIRDIINTEIGCGVGQVCKHLILLGWIRGCCEKACRALERGGVLW